MDPVLAALVSGGLSGIFTAILYRLVAEHLTLIKVEWSYKHALAVDVITTMSSSIKTFNGFLANPNRIVGKVVPGEADDHDQIMLKAGEAVPRKVLTLIDSSTLVGTPVLKPESLVDKIRDVNLRRWILLYYGACEKLKAASTLSEAVYGEMIKIDDAAAGANLPLEKHRIDVFDGAQRRMLRQSFMAIVYGFLILEAVFKEDEIFDYYAAEKHELLLELGARYGLTEKSLAYCAESKRRYDGKMVSDEQAAAEMKIAFSDTETSVDGALKATPRSRATA